MTKKKSNSLGSSSIISLVSCFICGMNSFSHTGTEKLVFIMASIGFFMMASGFYFDNKKQQLLSCLHHSNINKNKAE